MNYLTLAVQDSESQHSFVIHGSIFFGLSQCYLKSHSHPSIWVYCFFFIFFGSSRVVDSMGQMSSCGCYVRIWSWWWFVKRREFYGKHCIHWWTIFLFPRGVSFLFYLSDVLLQSLFSVLSSLLINFLIHISTVFLFQSYWVCCTFILFNFHFSLF